MSAIEWDATLETGIAKIDGQHQRLVEIYNELDAALNQGKAHKRMKEILDGLIDYTDMHFEDEEKVMEEAGYEALAYHCREHAQLLNKVRVFQRKLKLGQERINRPVMQFLNYWLTNHIKGSDMQFAESCRRKEEPETTTA